MAMDNPIDMPHTMCEAARSTRFEWKIADTLVPEADRRRGVMYAVLTIAWVPQSRCYRASLHRQLRWQQDGYPMMTKFLASERTVAEIKASRFGATTLRRFGFTVLRTLDAGLFADFTSHRHFAEQPALAA